jgi:hypothetical protein
MVGVVSDSYNCLGGAENDTLSGDLPYGNIILYNPVRYMSEYGIRRRSSYDAIRTVYREEADFAASLNGKRSTMRIYDDMHLMHYTFLRRSLH